MTDQGYPLEHMELCQLLVEWAESHELLMVTADGQTIHAPFTAGPTKFSAELYNEAVTVHPLFNSLVAQMVKERTFLCSLASQVAKYDEFIQGLYQIFEQVPPPAKYFSLNRSDYMVHDCRNLLQVEMNTISVAFPALSSKVAKMHRELVGQSTLDNDALIKVAEGFDAALKLYGKGCRNVLMIVRPSEVNTIDQDLLVAELRSRHNIVVHKKTLLDISICKSIGSGEPLLIDGVEYGVVYYRSGYTASDYPTDFEWTGRLILERSTAINCPDVGSQLAGMKKTQQVLCEAGILEKFISSEDAGKIRHMFAGMYALDNGETQAKIIKMVIDKPDDFVLKPQREGGGNNFYGLEMVKQLQSLSPSELSAYILMDLIKPLPYKTTLIRNRVAIECDAVCELGIYGVYVGNLEESSVSLNEPAGYLLRTKALGVLEGGVASGFSVLDSLELI